LCIKLSIKSYVPAVTALPSAAVSLWPSQQLLDFRLLLYTLGSVEKTLLLLLLLWLLSSVSQGVNVDAHVYVEAVHKAVGVALESLLREYLSDYPKLANEAISNAYKLLN